MYKLRDRNERQHCKHMIAITPLPPSTIPTLKRNTGTTDRVVARNLKGEGGGILKGASLIIGALLHLTERQDLQKKIFAQNACHVSGNKQ